MGMGVLVYKELYFTLDFYDYKVFFTMVELSIQICYHMLGKMDVILVKSW